MRLFETLIFTLWLSMLVAQPALAEKRVALVIGNSAYKNISSLANPANDARLMARVLKAQGFEVILGLDLQYRAMKRIIRRYTAKLRKHGRDTVGFIFYAGHGLQVHGTNYLVPVQAEIENEGDVDIETISASSLLFGVSEARNRLNIIVLDACRNNPYRSMFRSSSRGLSTMDAPRGALIAFSTGPGDVAADGSGKNSPFTKALAKSMQMKGLTIERVFKMARRKVYIVSNKRQLPWINSSVLGDFYPAGQGRKTPQPKTSGAGRDQDVAFWQDIRGSKDASDYEDYLQQFPKGTFARRARRLKKKYEKPPSKSKQKNAALKEGAKYTKAGYARQIKSNITKQSIINFFVKFITERNFKDFPVVVAFVTDATDQLNFAAEKKRKSDDYAAKGDWQNATLQAQQWFQYQVKAIDRCQRAKTHLDQNGAKKVK